jgi:hypothetical protein
MVENMQPDDSWPLRAHLNNLISNSPRLREIKLSIKIPLSPSIKALLNQMPKLSMLELQLSLPLPWTQLGSLGSLLASLDDLSMLDKLTL